MSAAGLGVGSVVRGKPPDLCVQIRARPPLAPAVSNGFCEMDQQLQNVVSVWTPSPLFALFDPVGWRGMPARPVAWPACGDFVLDPCRSPLEPWDEVVRGQVGMRRVEAVPAPDAGRSVPLQCPQNPLFSGLRWGHAAHSGFWIRFPEKVVACTGSGGGEQQKIECQM